VEALCSHFFVFILFGVTWVEWASNGHIALCTTTGFVRIQNVTEMVQLL
jgi:hypothetical protein